MEQVGRYEITGELGKGAMGVVYKALDPTIGRVVAFKTMRLDVSGMENVELVDRFRNEARSAGALHHPNLVTIYDAGEQDGLFYIAMEYIEGETLQSLLAERRVLPVEQIISVATQVCAGLDYAHSHGVVHRDIKPANVMIAADGTVKIMDFGVAKFGGGITNTGQVLGTPNYMSPEQVKGKSLDGRSDLFSVGVMLYEMLTGERPFVGQNVTTIIYKIVNETLIPPRELDVTIHPGLSAVVTRALAKAPEERYQTGADLARDLRDYKSFGADEPETMVLSAATLAAAAPAPAIIAPSSAPVPVAKLDHAIELTPHPAPPRSRVGRLYVLAALLLLALTAVGAVYYGRMRDVRQAASSLPPAPRPLAAPDIRTIESPSAAAGELRVQSSPPGVTFSVDGQFAPQWVTPFTVTRLAPGTHTVSLAKPGFVSQIQVAEVEPRKRRVLEVVLTTSRPTFVLSSRPGGAEVIIDGSSTGILTPAEITMEPGRHMVVLRKPGFADAVAEASLTEGQRYPFAPALQARPPESPARLPRLPGPQKTASVASGGTLILLTQPKGAEVLINDFALPQRTPVRVAMRAGWHELVLRLEGYKPLTRKIEIKNRKPLEINEPLEAQ